MKNKKTVLIDLERLKYINTGLGQVCLSFGKELAKFNSEHIQFVYLVPKKFNGYFGEKVQYETVSLFRKFMPFLCKKYDLWYSIHQGSDYFPGRSSVPYILTIHDLNFLKEKSEKKANRRLKKIQRRINKADKVLTISEYTKKVLLQYVTIPESFTVQTIYNGIEIDSSGTPVKPDFAPEGDILFNIGVIKEKKNQKVLIDFMINLPDNFSLILAGDKSDKYARDIEVEIDAKKLNDRIILPGIISDNDKFWLYRNSYAILFPSLLEGMGMPPIEAMKFGKLVFVSDKSSIPEICGEYAYYWKSFIPEYMSSFFLEKANEFYSDNENSVAVLKYAEKFSWQENIKAYVSVFMSVLEGSGE